MRRTGVCTHPQTVHTSERVSALLGLPLALAPALPARNVGRVGGRVRTLRVGAALHADGIVLENTTQDSRRRHFTAPVGKTL